MKKVFFLLFLSHLFLGTTVAQEPMRKTADGTTVINTTTLCNAKGYKSQTPVEVYIKEGRVVKVVALKNQESKGYFARIQKSLLPLYEGLKISKAKKLSSQQHVDATTGATYSTKAVQQNIHSALEYYK